MPEREDDHLTPATRLLEKRREMAEVEQALNAQKEVSCHAVRINLGSSKSKKPVRRSIFSHLWLVVPT